MERENESPLNEVEQEMFQQAEAALQSAIGNKQVMITSLLAARGVRRALNVGTNDDGTMLTWDTHPAEKLGAVGNSPGPNGPELVSAGDVPADYEAPEPPMTDEPEIRDTPDEEAVH